MENGPVDTAGRRERDRQRVAMTYTHHHVHNSQWALPGSTGRSAQSLEGLDRRVGGRPEEEGIHVYRRLTHAAVQQKLTQHRSNYTLIQINNLKQKLTLEFGFTGLSPT